ncbi:uncharacterized protein BO80DRAFT_359147 [Aspergillus ibericus CBS 121593]|uniref:Uncharacterized protein n=1 Tax=Aspergillus ibericus CBS 121593 TaxID=1448316 RepID=A0A395GVJ0_9EURO|nr:hypothetical protein BO80DRAFT_359147 [Aspergillus ibericus CBS 121593]RAK99516.1 hypothetical protein BO80DRAFT_359147 [Aspergillus ibericus CBS 121593]
MSVTIRAEIVDLDRLIPRAVDAEHADVAALIPWVFWNADVAPRDCADDWSGEDWQFRHFFYSLEGYTYDFNEESTPNTGITAALKANETIILPRKSWKVPAQEYLRGPIQSQGMMLYSLINMIYMKLEGICEHGPKVRLELPTVQKYVIGGKRFASKTAGAATVMLKDSFIPIISFTGWFEGQTWDQFLMETLSIMLGHLARNLPRSGELQDQEVYTVGFHGSYLHIGHGLFPADTIKRVHIKGFSSEEVFDMRFSRSYNLYLKKDWLEAMRALSRLFRYLLSGEAKVSVIQAYRRGENDTEASNLET